MQPCARGWAWGRFGMRYGECEVHQDFPGGSEVKASACNAGDLGSIPGSERSPGEGNGNPLQYSCLENPMDGGAWWATVHRSQRVGHDWTTSLLFLYGECVTYKDDYYMVPDFRNIFPLSGETQTLIISLANYVRGIDKHVSLIHTQRR